MVRKFFGVVEIILGALICVITFPYACALGTLVGTLAGITYDPEESFAMAKLIFRGLVSIILGLVVYYKTYPTVIRIGTYLINKGFERFNSPEETDDFIE